LSIWKPVFCLSFILLGIPGLNLSAQDISQRLEWAVENNDTAQVARILKTNPELLMTPLPAGGAPLGTAAALGHWETTGFLLEKGAGLQSSDPQGNQAYLAAYLNNHKGLAKFLITRGADPLSTDQMGNTLLHLMSKISTSWWPEILSGNYDLEVKNFLGQTPFMRAVWDENLTLADVLSREGVQTEEVDYLGRTVEDYARRNADEGMILFLYSLR